MTWINELVFSYTHFFGFSQEFVIGRLMSSINQSNYPQFVYRPVIRCTHLSVILVLNPHHSYTYLFKMLYIRR
jgi:hypothetical protein